MNLAGNQAFNAYVIAIVVLCLNLLILWVYSGAVRGKTKTTPNPEDARGASTWKVDDDPPEVARVLRAHKNAMANILPFAILGLVFVLAGGRPLPAMVLFGVFTAARVAHSFAYLGGKQPWRSVFFGIGGLATVVLIGFIVLTLATGA